MLLKHTLTNYFGNTLVGVGVFLIFVFASVFFGVAVCSNSKTSQFLVWFNSCFRFLISFLKLSNITSFMAAAAAHPAATASAFSRNQSANHQNQDNHLGLVPRLSNLGQSCEQLGPSHDLKQGVIYKARVTGCNVQFPFIKALCHSSMLDVSGFVHRWSSWTFQCVLR